jgi:hypothetical protein
MVPAPQNPGVHRQSSAADHAGHIGPANVAAQPRMGAHTRLVSSAGSHGNSFVIAVGAAPFAVPLDF